MKRINKKISVLVFLWLLFMVLNQVFNLSKEYYYVVQGITAAFAITFIIFMVEYRTLKKK